MFASFFGALKTYERTMGATLAAGVKAHLFEKRIRHFDSALQAALFEDNIPTAVYTQLLGDVHRSLPTLHRYLGLRKRMLGLDVLRYQDLYVPLVASVDMRFEPEEARAITLEALAPLGKDYTDALRKGFESRWTDFLPSPGKRSGAYSTGVYGVHPYQLLNFNGRYDDLSTLAHESGHSMHTFLSHQAQPYPTADYSIFVAEVASTFNENLLIHYMLGPRQGRRHAPVPAGYPAGRVAHHPVSADAVCRVRAGLPPAGGTGRATDRRESIAALSEDRPRILWARQEGLSGGRSAGHRMGVRAALLLQLLRLPVRHQHGGLHLTGPRGA